MAFPIRPDSILRAGFSGEKKGAGFLQADSNPRRSTVYDRELDAAIQ